MAIAILSDIHANLEAFEAVLRDRDKLNAEGRKIDRTYCLGDLVDYGANPREVIELARKECDVVIAGNHELYLLQKEEPEALYRGKPYYWDEPPVIDFVNWTREKLFGDSEIGILRRTWLKLQNTNEKLSQYLSSLPLIHKEDGLTLVHGTPIEGFYTKFYFKRDYMLRFLERERISLGQFMSDVFSNVDHLGFVGHTHIPVVTTIEDKDALMESVRGPQKIHVAEVGEKAIVNVGSVGQPKDNDLRACYVVLDDEFIEFRRVEYDIDETVRKIEQSEMPTRFLYQYKH